MLQVALLLEHRVAGGQDARDGAFHQLWQDLVLVDAVGEVVIWRLFLVQVGLKLVICPHVAFDLKEIFVLVGQLYFVTKLSVLENVKLHVVVLIYSGICQV